MDSDRVRDTGGFHPDTIAVTKNRFTNQYLAAAVRLGLETTPLSSDRRTWVITGRGRRLTVRAAILGCNSRQAVRFSSNKYLTHLLMARQGIPMPEYAYFVARDDVEWTAAGEDARAFARGRYPVVAKAVSGSGAKNVHAGIENDAELDWALQCLQHAQVREFIVERQLTGRLCRIQVFDGEIIGIVYKHPGVVVGDGRSTIRELVGIDDRERVACGQGAMTLGTQVRRHLGKHGLDPESILPRGVEQTLAAEISGRLGCRIEPLPLETMPPSGRTLFRRAAAASGLRWVGFDYFCDDITDPSTAHRGAFNEVNSAPVPRDFEPGMTESHYLGKAKTILARYFDLAAPGEAAA